MSTCPGSHSMAEKAAVSGVARFPSQKSSQGAILLFVLGRKDVPMSPGEASSTHGNANDDTGDSENLVPEDETEL